MNIDGHDSAAHYLHDLGGLVRDMALRAKAEYADMRDSHDAQYLLQTRGRFTK